MGTAGGTTAATRPGGDARGILAATLAGELGGLVVAGVDPDDMPHPATAWAALDAARFVVSLELRATGVSERADVVFPVAPVDEKGGSFVDWEGRVRSFGKVLRDAGALPDLRVLSGIAEEMGVDLGFRTIEQAWAEMTELGAWDGERAAAPAVSAAAPAPDAASVAEAAGVEATLASWKLLIDDGRMLDGEDYLKATGRRAVVLVPAAVLDQLGVQAGSLVTLSGPAGSVVLPVAVADLPDGVVWAPASSGGINLVRDTGAAAGSVVRLAVTTDGGVA
jgi:NADH-quinone oxidoreductase subunit G